MKNLNQGNTFKNVINAIKKVLDVLIISICLTIPTILVIGAINAIFDLDGSLVVGGIRRAGLGSDFGLVLRLTIAFAALAGFLALIRYGGVIWGWMASRPWTKWGAVALTTVLLSLWLVSSFRKTPAERLAIAINESNLNQTERVLSGNDLDLDYLDLQLSRTVDEGKFDIADALITAGAEVTRATDYGDYPLITATMMFGEKEAIFFLLEQDIDPNQTDEYGQTPLITLLDFRLPKENLSMSDGVVIVQALLDLGADPLLTDDFGRSAKEYAEERNYAQINPLFR